jgi:hypothetical protein
MEEYKIISGFENYSISNLGNVMNTQTGKVLKACPDKDGYLHVKLYKDSKSYTKIVHRLVAQAFIPNPNNKPCVDHIDNNKQNNHVTNLRWVTIQENTMNSSLSKRNTSGVKGVSFNKKAEKWTAQILLNGTRKFLGNFDTKEEALEARLNAVEKYFGEYANKCEKELILNIKMSKQTKLKININIDDDEEYKNLEKEFEELVKN